LIWAEGIDEPPHSRHALLWRQRIHLPRGAEAEWIKQLVAEQLVTVTTRRGFQKLEWHKLRERNEVLDCRVYARAAAWIAGADRWTGAKWRDLEDQLGPAPGQTDGHRVGDEPAPVTAGMLARAPRATGTRRSTWLAVDKGWLK
jgi:phage terminase large subunit GpA-like protein